MKTKTVDRFSERDLQADLCRRNLYAFVKEAWPIIVPGSEFVDNWVTEAVCAHLSAVSGFDTDGNPIPFEKRIRRLIINVPPRTAKSNTATVCWPAWEWIQMPWTQWLFISYSEDLILSHAVARRRLIESDWYQSNWGLKSNWGRMHPELAFMLRPEEYGASRFSNTRGGVHMSSTMDGQNTGFGGNRLCLPYEALVTTDVGEIPIGKIVEERLSVKVLGSGGWQSIERYEKSPGRPLLELETDCGSVSCTFEHPVFIETGATVIGFVKASCAMELFIYHEKVYVRQLKGGKALIRSVLRYEAPDFVYNLSVAPHHDYYVNSFLLHNCLDDPNNVRRAESELIRNAANNVVDTVLPTRLNNPKKDAWVVIQQRTHEDDVSGHLLAGGDFEHLCIPMEYDGSDLVEVHG